VRKIEAIMSNANYCRIRPHWLNIALVCVGIVTFLGLALFGRSANVHVEFSSDNLGKGIATLFFAACSVGLLLMRAIEVDSAEIRVYWIFGSRPLLRKDVRDVQRVELIPGERWKYLAQKFQHHRVTFRDGKTLWIPCSHLGAEEGVQLLRHAAKYQSGN
jgi:hypothetical protein